MGYDLTGFKIINGTADDETLTGTSAKNAIYGNGGADRLNGGLGTDVLFGGAGGGVTFEYALDSTWTGASARNVGDPDGAGSGITYSLAGYGRSHDVFVGAGSNNTLEMGDGKRALFFEDALSPGVDTYRLYNIQTIVMGSGGQLVDLTSTVRRYGDVTINGGSGDDIVLSNAGKDTISGGDGRDTLWGGSGNDRLMGDAGDDILDGATGNDYLDGGAGADTMRGGVGNDTYVVDSTSDVISESADQGADIVLASIDYTLAANIENVRLTGFAVAVTGNDLDNTMTGNFSANVMDGGLGKDTLSGGDGNDRLSGGEGDDKLTGDYGDDTLLGNAGTDNLNGGAGADLARGGIGNDYLFGGGGNDRLYGDDGNDRIWGDGSNDIITGGRGDDVLKGGDAASRYPAGNDTFVWDLADVVNADGTRAGFDHIVDFSSGDRLDFGAVFPGVDPGPISDMVRLTERAGSTIVSLNLGAGFIEVVQLDGVTGLNLNTLVSNGWLLT